MTWTTKEFKDLVKACYGEEQVKKLDRPLSSIFWKKMLAQYHSEESIRLYRSYLSVESVEGSKEELIQVVNQVLVAASGSEKENRFLKAVIPSEAHVIAFAQSIHSIADILAQVIYVGLNLDINLTKPIPEDKRNLYNVNEGMRKKKFAPNVVKSVDTLKQLPEYQYLQAYVNTTKHYRLVNATHFISLVSETPKYGLQIPLFEYKGHSFTEKWTTDFVVKDFKTIWEGFFCVLNELNKYLRTLEQV